MCFLQTCPEISTNSNKHKKFISEVLDETLDCIRFLTLVLCTIKSLASRGISGNSFLLFLSPQCSEQSNILLFRINGIAYLNVFTITKTSHCFAHQIEIEGLRMIKIVFMFRCQKMLLIAQHLNIFVYQTFSLLHKLIKRMKASSKAPQDVQLTKIPCKRNP